jgi:hypothetical protein
MYLFSTCQDNWNEIWWVSATKPSGYNQYSVIVLKCGISLFLNSISLMIHKFYNFFHKC